MRKPTTTIGPIVTLLVGLVLSLLASCGFPPPPPSVEKTASAPEVETQAATDRRTEALASSLGVSYMMREPLAHAFPQGAVLQAPPLKDTQGWTRAYFGTAPDHWYRADVEGPIHPDGSADLIYRRFDHALQQLQTVSVAGIPCWVAPHPHVVPGGPPFNGFVYPTPDPRDAYVGIVGDVDPVNPLNLLVTGPDGMLGTVVTSVPNADLMSATWTFPMYLVDATMPIPDTDAATLIAACDLP